MAYPSNEILRIAIEALLVAILVYAPVAFGAAAPVYRPPIWIACALLFALNVVFLVRGRASRLSVRSSEPYRPPILPLWFFGGFLLLVLFYLVPLPAAFARLFGSAPPRPGLLFYPIHPHPEEGLRALFDWFCACTLFLTASTFPDTRRQLERILFVILAIAGFEAIYGMVEFAGGGQHIFGYQKMAYSDSATGTFINRNHFANYLVMAICITAGMVTYRWSKSSGKGNHQGGPLEKIFLLSFYSILLGAALVFSKSRAGLVCLVFALAGMGVFYAKSYRKAYFTALIVVALLVAAFSVWIGVNPLPTRFLGLPGEVTTEDARPAVWAQSVKLWTMAPLIGHGPSTFEDAFRSFGGGNILARYQHAHNDYLEILVEAGVLGFLLLLGGVGVSIAMTVANLSLRNSKFARMHSLGMVAAVFAVLIHGLLDFNLQIPANRLTFFTILGLAYLTAGRRLRQ